MNEPLSWIWVAKVVVIPQVGLWQARVGLHTGPVVFQDGDYFGRTVNVAARITDYARPGGGPKPRERW
jgi:class 3 adenylate cyclase